MFVFSCSCVELIILILLFCSLLWELWMLYGWIIRKDPERLGSEGKIGGEWECCVYLLLILSSPAWFWCNRSCIIIYIPWEGMFVWYKMHILRTLVIQLLKGEGCLPSCYRRVQWSQVLVMRFTWICSTHCQRQQNSWAGFVVVDLFVLEASSCWLWTYLIIKYDKHGVYNQKRRPSLFKIIIFNWSDCINFLLFK